MEVNFTKSKRNSSSLLVDTSNFLHHTFLYINGLRCNCFAILFFSSVSQSSCYFLVTWMEEMDMIWSRSATILVLQLILFMWLESFFGKRSVGHDLEQLGRKLAEQKTLG